MKVRKSHSIRSNNWIQFLSVTAVIIALNILSSLFFTRFDLTAEKRFSLSPGTKEMLKNLDEIIYVRVYLDGKHLPSDFSELSIKTREMLDEMRAYSAYVEYEFIDPTKNKNTQELNAFYSELYQKGLRPQAIQSVEADGVNTQYVVPGALISYKQFEIPVPLVDSDEGLRSQREDIIKYSIEKLEYNIGNAIRRITNQQQAKVAFMKGHGELSNIEVLKAAVAIAQFYQVDSVNFNNNISAIFNLNVLDSVTGDYTIKNNKYDLLIFAKPTRPFADFEKFLIDQYVMRGGRILWYIDPVMAEIDSLYSYPEMPVLPRELNLEDLFFRYGVRLNANLLQDFNALPIPVGGEQVGGQTQFKLIPFYYFPIITPFVDHPVVKNLSLLRTEFVSSIDTIGSGNVEVKKTILLTTSPTTKVVNAPSTVSLEVLKRRADIRQFSKQHLPISVLVEGRFNSLYTDLRGENLTKLGVLLKSEPTKMIFVSDGDMIKNQIGSDNYVYPLGFDKNTGSSFANRNFLLNAVNYLCDDENIAQVRSKDFKMRLLDKNKTLKERTFWQSTNLLFPLLLITLLGLVLMIIRRFSLKK